MSLAELNWAETLLFFKKKTLEKMASYTTP